MKIDSLIGKSASAFTVVGDSNTAEAVGSGSLAVFATPMMVALMEEAACKCLAGLLEAGQSSVGTQINVAHTAASPVGAKITATATLTAVEGRKLSFEISAEDEKNKIGSGSHTRFIIDVERFMSKL